MNSEVRVGAFKTRKEIENTIKYCYFRCVGESINGEKEHKRTGLDVISACKNSMGEERKKR